MSGSTTVDILFIDDDDRCLAPLAEALFAHEGRKHARAVGAGLVAEPRLPAVNKVLQERNVSPVERPPTCLHDLHAPSFDLVVTLGREARKAFETHEGSCRKDAPPSSIPLVFAGAPLLLHWELPSPPNASQNGVEPIRVLRDLLSPRIHGLLDHGFLETLTLQRNRLDRIMDTLDEGLMAHDGQRRIFLFNRAAEEITGLRRDEVLGRHCAEIFPPDGLCGAECHFCHGGPDALHRYESFRDFVCPSGAVKRLKIGICPMEVGRGCATGAVAALRDITEITRLHEARYRKKRVFHGMVGATPEMLRIFETIRQVASSDYPVLITGESGTGKELVAQAVHGESRRREGPFIPINCGALPEPILESELFGHVRGAFTGAVRDKKGRFTLAHGGTIFLDEVGELSPSFQVKLLRVLQESRFEPVGSERTIEVDVRVVSATNRDLRSMVREGRFREDLFYRLCVVPIQLPPLRERREDLGELVRHFLAMIRKETGKVLGEPSPQAMDLLRNQAWPGNVRQLINALRHAAVRCVEGPIELEHLPPDLSASQTTPPSPAGSRSSSLGNGLQRRGKLSLDAVEEALNQCGGNKLQAAKALGVGRATLYRFLNRHMSQ